MKKVFDNYDFKIATYGLSLRWIICDHMNTWYSRNIAAYEEIIKLECVVCRDLEYVEYNHLQWCEFKAVLHFLEEIKILNTHTYKNVITNVNAYLKTLETIIEREEEKRE